MTGRLGVRTLGRILAAAGAAATVFTGVGLLGPQARAMPQSFTAVASAEGMRQEFVVHNFLVVESLVDVGSPVAQATVDDTGDSEAYAAAPYPGDTVLTAPGLVNGQAGGALPPQATTYPLIATSSYPTNPKSAAGADGYALTAVSRPTSSQASAASGRRAQSGVTVGALTAGSAVARSPSGQVTATATSDDQSVTIAGVLRLGRVSAAAAVTRDPGGLPRRSSAFAVDAATVAGIPVRIDRHGLTVAGTTTPAPGNPVSQQLKSAGITVRYLHGITDPDGVVSPGVEVDVIEPGTPIGTPMVRFVFGRASAHASSGGLGASDTATTGGRSARHGSVGSTPHPAGSEPQPAASPADLSADAAPPTRSEAGSGPGAPPVVAPAGGTVAAPAAATSPAPFAGIGFYLPLVLAASAVLLSGQLIRLLGVSRTWISRHS